MGLCPIAPPKGFPLALWKPSGAKLTIYAILPAEVNADSVRLPAYSMNIASPKEKNRYFS